MIEAEEGVGMGSKLSPHLIFRIIYFTGFLRRTQSPVETKYHALNAIRPFHFHIMKMCISIMSISSKYILFQYIFVNNEI